MVVARSTTVVRQTVNLLVVGSNPTEPVVFPNPTDSVVVVVVSENGGLPKRQMGLTVDQVFRLRGFESLTHH